MQMNRTDKGPAAQHIGAVCLAARDFSKREDGGRRFVHMREIVGHDFPQPGRRRPADYLGDGLEILERPHVRYPHKIIGHAYLDQAAGTHDAYQLPGGVQYRQFGDSVREEQLDCPREVVGALEVNRRSGHYMFCLEMVGKLVSPFLEVLPGGEGEGSLAIVSATPSLPQAFERLVTICL